MPPDQLVTLGFVGCGNFARNLATACASIPGIRIGACYDRDPVASQTFADQFGCRCHGEFAELCADADLDGAVIAAPNDCHHPLAVALATAGKHIFVEKPICLTLEEADSMITTCRERGVVLAVGHQERRQPAFRRIKQLIDDGSLGKIHTFEANHCGNLLNLWPQNDWRFDSNSGSGPLIHKGIHKMDVLNYCFGTVASIATMASTIPFNPSMHETTVSILRFENGIMGSLTSGFRYNNASFNVYGEKASVFYSGNGPQLTIKDEATWERSTITCGGKMGRSEGSAIQEELAEFAATLRGNATVEVDGQVAREALLVALAAAEAEHSQRIVALDSLRPLHVTL